KSRSRAKPASSFCLSAAQLVPPRAHWWSALHDAGASGREEVSWLIRSGREPTRLWLFSSLCLCLPGESLSEQNESRALNCMSDRARNIDHFGLLDNIQVSVGL